MMDEFISRQALKDLGSECIAKRDENGNLMPLGSIDSLPSVNPQASKEDIHREREQAYMKGYEDASKRYRTEPCEDAISRSEAISVASGYCHWSNIPTELAKLPSVNPIPCEDAISRAMAIGAFEKRANMDWERLKILEPLLEEIENLPPVSVAEKTQMIDKSNFDEEQYRADLQCAYECGENSGTEKVGRCKDCKWWKDSDGIYRRGSHAESQCPINRKEVFEGNGYCYMYEPQESEE